MFICRGEPRPGFRRLSRTPDAAGFSHFRREDDRRRLDHGHANGTHDHPPARDWHATAEHFAAALTPDRRAELASLIGLPADALAALPLLGWCEAEGCWTVPETDPATGRVSCLNRRFRDGTKKVMSGGRRALTLPTGWRNRAGPVLIVEGASDVLALTLCGLAAVGRPSNTGGVEQLAALLATVPADRELVVVGENDQKADGTWPGRTGAQRTAEALAQRLGRPVRWSLPPADAKDARAWSLDLAAGAAEAVDWPAIGRTVAGQLLAAAEPRPSKPRWPLPVPATQLPDTGPAVDWLWEGCLARGHITLISALAKAGKTTFVSHLFRSLQHGAPFLGRETRPTRTLVVSEESEAIWRGRRDALALDDHLHLLCRPMIAKPSVGDWLDFLNHVARCAAGFDAVAFDTIAAFAPWRDENDAAEIVTAVTPLNVLTGAGLAVTLFHHHGKADGGEGKAVRGSTALAGAVDIMLELRRFKPDDRDDRRRVLSGMGRFDEIPSEIVIALAEDGTGYSAEGDRKAVRARELAEAIARALPGGPPGATADDIHAELPEDLKPKRGDVMKALRGGADAGTWQSTGTGKPRDPRRFWRG